MLEKFKIILYPGFCNIFAPLWQRTFVDTWSPPIEQRGGRLVLFWSSDTEVYFWASLRRWTLICISNHLSSVMTEECWVNEKHALKKTTKKTFLIQPSVCSCSQRGIHISKTLLLFILFMIYTFLYCDDESQPPWTSQRVKRNIYLCIALERRWNPACLLCQVQYLEPEGNTPT